MRDLKRFYFKKRGLSPVIATVLLIMLALALVVIVFLWISGFISEQLEKQGKPIDQMCKEINFHVENEYDKMSAILNLQVVNRGNVNIYGLDVKFIENKGSSMMKSFKLNVPVGESSDIQAIPVAVDVKEVVLYPMILGSVRGKGVNKPTSCLDKGLTVKLQ